MKTTNCDITVNMLEYNESALSALLTELLNSDIVGKNSKRTYNVAASFDTETSSFYDDDGNPVGLCYIWMFGIGGTVVYGRQLDQYVELMWKLNGFLAYKNARLFVFVHNLKYDFAFIKRLFRWDDVFIRQSREPLYAKWRMIEYRDSLALSGGQSLANIGKKVLRKKIYKAVGDLNYDLLRTSDTPMTPRELHYCEFDIRVLNEYITEKIEDDGDILKIPLTNTGYVRRYVRDECFRNRAKYMNFIDGLTMTPDCYLQFEYAFAGGASGPNIKYAGKISEDVNSYDIKSSYPYVILTGYYPMEYFIPVTNREAKERFDEFLDKYCCVFRLEIFNLDPRTDNCFPITYDKCKECVGARIAAGRVVSAAYVSLNVTELDYKTIKRFYRLEDADEVRITRMRIAKRGYLPKPIVKSCLKFFYDKTTLDGVPEMKREYMLAKNMLNAIYGMMVQRPVRDEYFFADDFDKRDKDYVGQVDEYNENRNRFLFYPWGVWVTAHARYRLYDAIYHIGDDWRYCDTDSVKFVGDHAAYFEEENRKAKEELEKLSKRFNIPMSDIVPHSPSGDPKYLGVWEHEYKAKRFKTLGPKRYLIEYAEFGDHKEGELELTVSGANKKNSIKYLKLLASLTPEQIRDFSSDDIPNTETLRCLRAASDMAGKDIFDIFSDGLTIPSEYANRLVAKFVDSERSGYIIDHTGERRWYSAPSGIHMEPSAYSFHITGEMKAAVEWLMCGRVDGEREA